MGCLGLKSPRQIKALIAKSPDTNAKGWNLSMKPVDRYIPPTYMTTIAVFIADSRIPDKRFALDLNRLAIEWNETHPDDKGWVTYRRPSPDGVWYFADPSSQLLAQYLCGKTRHPVVLITTSYIISIRLEKALIKTQSLPLARLKGKVSPTSQRHRLHLQNST